jgi:uncharacterized OB-fold protein
MAEITQETEAFIAWTKVEIPYHYSAGKIGSRFLIELRDNKRIMGVRCPTCNRVEVPPRATCKICFTQLDELVEVSDKGTLLTYTVVHQPNAVQPVETPFAYGIIQLDGSDTGFVHMLGEVDLDQVKIGMRVQAVFKEERVASVLDIKHFKPLD